MSCEKLETIFYPLEKKVFANNERKKCGQGHLKHWKGGKPACEVQKEDN